MFSGGYTVAAYGQISSGTKLDDNLPFITPEEHASFKGSDDSLQAFFKKGLKDPSWGFNSDSTHSKIWLVIHLDSIGTVLDVTVPEQPNSLTISMAMRTELKQLALDMPTWEPCRMLVPLLLTPYE